MKIVNILERHVESYDRDCGDHDGCSCGWVPGPRPNSAGPAVWWERDQFRAHLAEVIETAFEWAPTGWWRAVSEPVEGEPPLSAIWCESSDEAEVRAAARETDTVMRLERSVRARWVQA